MLICFNKTFHVATHSVEFDQNTRITALVAEALRSSAVVLHVFDAEETELVILGQLVAVTLLNVSTSIIAGFFISYTKMGRLIFWVENRGKR